MISILLQFIPLALAAISPGLLLAALLLLGTQNGLRKVLALTLGKYLAYIGWGVVLLILSDLIAGAGGIETPTIPAALKLILGVLLLVLAGGAWLVNTIPTHHHPNGWRYSKSRV